MLFLRKKKKIDFIVIGVQKAGTSALDYYLRKHPQIKMAKLKEVHFFDDDLPFKEKNVDYSIYHNFFENLDHKYLYGEVTPIYIYWQNALKRIKNYNKNIKLVVIFRNPTLRAFSHWNMEVSRGAENRSFQECIISDINSTSQDRITSYVDRGMYGEQISRLLELFKRDQLLFLKYEDFLQNQKATISEILNFLKLESLINIEEKIIRKIQYSQKLSKSNQLLLQNYYLDEIESVEELLNWNCEDWKDIQYDV